MECIEEAVMNKRGHPRMPVKDMAADISDGKYFFSGTVHDISRFGVALEDIPQKLSASVPRLTIILNGQGKHFKLKAVPRWETQNGIRKTIGCQIEQCPVNWTEFVMRFEPETDDIWGNNA